MALPSTESRLARPRDTADEAVRALYIGADQIRLLPTWQGPGIRSNLRLMGRAARVIAETIWPYLERMLTGAVLASRGG